LWRQAEELARRGEPLPALRTLYLAVLALLHRASLIRYERTRTNGEYAQQLRRSEAAPAGVPEAFGRLTNTFEVKWYGERACQRADFDACRRLAEEIRSGVESAR
jgi:hypothetical protein